MKCGLCDRRTGGRGWFCFGCGHPACKDCRREPYCDDCVKRANEIRDREEAEREFDEDADDVPVGVPPDAHSYRPGGGRRVLRKPLP